MKVLNVAPSAPYNEGWGYQENLLTKYQKKLGHDVTLIVSNVTFKKGKHTITNCEDFINGDGVRVIRLPRKQYAISALTKLKVKMDVFDKIKEIYPDFIFYHGLGSDTILDVVRYKKEINPNCVIVCDNHADYNIGFNKKGLRSFLVMQYQRRINKKAMPYVERVYGVTPWRQRYAEDFYSIPSSKTDLLIMGADEEKIRFEQREEIRREFRQKHGIADDEFLIVTGGKLDKKKKVEYLIKACKGLDKVKLIVFGVVKDDIKEEFDNLLKEIENATFIGWVDADDVYDCFFGSDLVFFPGQHSVLWEQACASKTPCVFQKWDGMEHVDNGGNSDFIYPITEENIREKIKELQFTEKYEKMKRVALSDKTDVYLYGNIAKKSLECAINGSK